MEESSAQPGRTQGRRRSMGCLVGLLLLGVGAAAATLFTLKEHNRDIQLQTDPAVATVWLAGVTWGPNHTLVTGSPWQKWLNDRNITAFGSYRALHSQYDGEPGVELWFDYRSYLSGRELECHRVEETAFTDDLGQPFHGYLDFQGKMVGVYLPAYDHAAHRLFCTLHWMPRRPNPSFPVSSPMQFSVEVPPTPRLLPLAESLPHGSQTITHQGISITVSEAQLGPVEIRQTPYSGQRRLTFRMKVTGGEIANPNVDLGGNTRYAPGFGAIFVEQNGRTGIRSINPTQERSAESGWGPLSITDPYGIELIPATQYVVPGGPGGPLAGSEHLESADGKEILWSVQVSNAGKGTDVLRLRFGVRPTRSAASSASDTLPEAAPFDLLLPVQTGNEI